MHPIKALLLLAALPLAGRAQGLVEEINNCSHTVSLIHARTIASFEGDTNGFTAGNAVEKVEPTDGHEFYPAVHEGKGALAVRSRQVAGDEWRTAVRRFAKPIDLRKTPFVEFAIFTAPAPVSDMFVRLSLFSRRDSFSCVARIMPTLWRTLTFDCTGCRFLKKVERMEIALCAPTPEVWATGRDFLIDGIRAGMPLDLNFASPQSAAAFRATGGGKVSAQGDALVFSFKKPGAAVLTTLLAGSLHNLFSPPTEQRNTVRAVIANRCGADSIRVGFTTTKDSNFAAHTKVFPLDCTDSEPHNYFFNFSDIASAGNYAGLRFEPLHAAKGSLAIERITFEREEPIVERVGKIASCRADSSHITILANIGWQAATKYKEVKIYTLPIELTDMSKARLIYSSTALAPEMEITAIPFRRTDHPDMTHLSSRFIATLSDGTREVRLGAPFFIENWEDFTTNPYDFLVTDEDFNVLDYGAKGDGFTDDTRAFQLAVNAASGSGSGRVVVPGDTASPYGRRYVITSVELRHDVELRIEPGAVVWQSGDRRDYGYSPLYGHDMVIPGIPWTHSHFVNKPMFFAMGQQRIKICGGGTIRMCDPYASDPDIHHYAASCEDRIHIVPLAFSDCSDIVLQDIDVVRTNCYHTSFDCDSNIFVGNVKFYDPACVSADGLGLSGGTHRVKISRFVFASNDDGVTLSSSYRDPRNSVSPWRAYHDTAPHGARCVEVEHSYINSGVGGGGKAIAFIPWGSTNPEPQNQIIDSITVSDCTLAGGYSVGTWPDNPFDGKPFTNAETDDFSTIQDVKILNNEYLNDCSLLCVTPTNFYNDCGIASSSRILNGDFRDGRCYWSRRGEVRISRSGAEVSEGQTLFQGLTLAKGNYRFTVNLSGRATLRAVERRSGQAIATATVAAAQPEEASLAFTAVEPGDYLLEIVGGNAQVTQANLSPAQP